MDKVKITREQANAIDCAKKTDYVEIVRQHSLDNTGTEFAGEYKALNDLSLNTLIKALYLGYEVEETPEDKVREMFDGKRPDGFDLGDVLSYRKGIMDTLKALNIKIEGIN